MKKIALIVAAGKGERMNADIPKQFLLLNDLPILMYTLNAFADLDKRILVLPKSQIENWKALCKDYNFELNHYTYHRSETIIYCIPKEKS